MDLAAMRIDHRHGLSGVVDEEFFTGAVTLAHDQIEFAGPASIALAEPTVLKAIRFSGFVFLPKQKEGDTFALEFAVDISPIGRYGSQLRSGQGPRWKQELLQGLVIESVGQRPRQAGWLGSAQVLGHGGPTDAHTLGNLALAETLAPFET
jgi:hypothetical protein